MYGIPENPIIDTKNTNLSLFCRKWYEFIARPSTNGGHLGFFTHNAMAKISSDNTTMYGIPEKPHDECLKHEFACIILKMIWIYCLTLNKWRPSWIFLPTMQCLKYLLTTPLCTAYLKNLMMNAWNTNLRVLFWKWYEFTAWPWTNGGHLGFFYPQCNV